jgi:23S rRNA (pseudouridine1915-N3)-methyltransferase
MKFTVLTTLTKPEPWIKAAHEVYIKKLKAFAPFELVVLKDKGDVLKQMRKRIGPADYVVLLDEEGIKFTDSPAFAKRLEGLKTRGHVVFVIGGPFGVDLALRERAGEIWSLGSLTMSHLVAQVVFLEQLYRGWTILNRLPYHNAGRLGSAARR